MQPRIAYISGGLSLEGMSKNFSSCKNFGMSVGTDLCVCPEAAQLPNRGRHTGH